MIHPCTVRSKGIQRCLKGPLGSSSPKATKTCTGPGHGTMMGRWQIPRKIPPHEAFSHCLGSCKPNTKVIGKKSGIKQSIWKTEILFQQPFRIFQKCWSISGEFLVFFLKWHHLTVKCLSVKYQSILHPFLMPISRNNSGGAKFQLTQRMYINPK